MDVCGKTRCYPFPQTADPYLTCVYKSGHGGYCRAGSGADALVAEITRTLTAPGHPAHAVRTLNHADAAFGRLDFALRRGGQLPSGWKVAPDACDPAHEYVDTLYDLVSETLRDRGGPPTCWKALRSAGASWASLVQVMHEGSPLPGPWSRE